MTIQTSVIKALEHYGATRESDEETIAVLRHPTLDERFFVTRKGVVNKGPSRDAAERLDAMLVVRACYRI